MGVKIIDRETPDGRRLRNVMAQLERLECFVGFQAGDATEEDGADVCSVAAWNEYGTSTIPSRPFLRKSVDENKDRIDSAIRDAVGLMFTGGGAKDVYSQIGLFQKDLVQEKILTGSFAPNAPSTIKKKGSSKPLVDTGRMLQSVNYVIKKKGSF